MNTVTNLVFAVWKLLKAKVLGWSSWDTEQARFVLLVFSITTSFYAIVLWLNAVIDLGNPGYGALKQLFTIH